MGRGLLVFKGDKKSKKKKKKKSKHEPPHYHQEEPAAAASASPTKATAAETPKLQKGTGLITTSGTVVTGHETCFQRELAVGDALLIGGGDRTDDDDNNQKKQQQPQEMRVVTMCLSQTAVNISSAFSTNLSRPTHFSYIRKPRASTTAAAAAPAAATIDPSGIYGTASSSKELVYREKTEHGSYRIKRVQVDQELSRGDLLHMRTKRKSDKYC